jgi:hypothetical protein
MNLVYDLLGDERVRRQWLVVELGDSEVLLLI